jgi:DNA-binding IclR family transcriptional regulator
MNIEKVRLLLKTLQTAAMFPRGEGLMTPTEIIKKSGVSHATTYRYLSKMLDMGYVKVKPYQCRKLTCYKYRISEEGLEYMKQFKTFRKIYE